LKKLFKKEMSEKYNSTNEDFVILQT